MLNRTKLIDLLLRAVLLVLLALVIFIAAARADSFNPATAGAVYGKSDPATAAANDAAVAQAIQSIAATGGGDLVLTGSLAITQTIQPPTVTYNEVTGFPVHFRVRGSGANAELYDINGGVAIQFPLGRYPANLPGYDLRQGILDLAVRGGSVIVTGGGKYVRISGLNIYGVPSGTGLEVSQFDGGWIHANIHDSPGATGFSITDAHSTHVDLISRINGAGGVIDGSVLNGSIYCESNAGLGLRMTTVTHSNLALWLEGNGWITEGQRRACWGNIFTGMDQGESNQGWDDDPISRVANLTPNMPQASWGQVIAPNLGLDVSKWAPTEIEVAGNQLTIHPAAFAAAGSSRVVLLTGNLPGQWTAGDFFIFQFSIAADPAALAFFKANQTASGNALRFAGQQAAGGAPLFGQNAWINGPSTTITAIEQFPAAAGQPMQLYFWPAVMAPKAPAGDIKLTVTGQIFTVSGH